MKVERMSPVQSGNDLSGCFTHVQRGYFVTFAEASITTGRAARISGDPQGGSELIRSRNSFDCSVRAAEQALVAPWARDGPGRGPAVLAPGHRSGDRSGPTQRAAEAWVPRDPLLDSGEPHSPGRRGDGPADHHRPLTRPREVRNVIVYVLTNFRHHDDRRDRERDERFDPWSSARWFRGWTERPPPPATPSPVAEPRTWLLGVGWRRYGLIRPEEAPIS
jgi:hypothetical protein